MRPNKTQLRSSHPVPEWRSADRTLYFHGSVVKRFRRPAKNQELILAAFQEQEWPESIDDPLPGDGKVNRKRRLHDAIKQLNRNQKYRRIRFRSINNGQGILWEPFEQN